MIFLIELKLQVSLKLTDSGEIAEVGIQSFILGWTLCLILKKNINTGYIYNFAPPFLQ